MASRLIKYCLFGLCLLGAWNLAIAGKFYAKAWLADQLIDRAWQASLNGEYNVRPWPWADTWPVAELEVPRLNIRQIILSGDSGRILAFGPGLNESSILSGEHGLSLISAHRDTHFSFLKDIKIGDQLTIRNTDEISTYIVDELSVVDQRDFQVDEHIMKNQNRGLLLVTCYPFDALKSGGDLRFIAFAKRVEVVNIKRS